MDESIRVTDSKTTDSGVNLTVSKCDFLGLLTGTETKTTI